MKYCSNKDVCDHTRDDANCSSKSIGFSFYSIDTAHIVDHIKVDRNKSEGKSSHEIITLKVCLYLFDDLV